MCTWQTRSNSSSTVHGVRKFNKDYNSYIPWQCHPPWACSMVSPPNHHSARLQQGLNWSHCHWETKSAVTEDPLCTYKHWVAAFIWMIKTVWSYLYLQPQQFNAEQGVDDVLVLLHTQSSKACFISDTVSTTTNGPTFVTGWTGLQNRNKAISQQWGW